MVVRGKEATGACFIVLKEKEKKNKYKIKRKIDKIKC